MPTPENEVEPPRPRFRSIRSHARDRRVPLWVVFVLIVGLAAAGAALRFMPGSPLYPKESGATLTAPMPFRSAEITTESLGTEGFLSWAYLDQRDGSIVGSANLSDPAETASMIGVWFGADYLRRSAESGATPPDADLIDIRAMIAEGDGEAVERVVAKLGGANDSVDRMITMCQLSDSSAGDGDWSSTVISARDAVRLGSCLADGRAAGAQWTPWIMDALRQVGPGGEFGIRKAFAAPQRATIATANAWVLRQQDGLWHANCLAVTDTWALAVMQRYPSHGDQNTDLAHIDAVCRDVVRRLTA